MSEVNWQEQVKALIDGEKYEDAIAFLSSGFKKYDHPDYDLYLGLIYLLKQDKEKASETWLVGSINSNNIEVFKANLLNLLEFYGFTLANQRKLDQVRKILDVILEIREDYQNPDLDKIITLQLESLYNLGISCVQNKQYVQAESNFKGILSFLFNDSPTWYNLSVLYYETNRMSDAYIAVNHAINDESRNANYWYLLGLIYTKKGDTNKAIEAYHQSLKLDPNFFDALNNLGNSYKELKQFAEAEKCYRQAIELHSQHCGAYVNLGNLLIIQKKYQQSLEIYKQACQLPKLTPELFDGWLETLNQLGQTKEAIKVGEQGIMLFPDDLILFCKYNLLLPLIYLDQDEIDVYRNRFSRGLQKFNDKIQYFLMSDPQKILKFFQERSISNQTNFYLFYQAYNDVGLQKKYGNMVCQISKVLYPNLVHKKHLVSSLKKRKIRVGYISQRMNSLLGRLLIGWIKYQNREVFEVYSYDIGDIKNSNVKDYETYSDYYYFLPQQIDKICEQIIQDQLDILVFFEIGIDSIMTQLASFKLASIQCATWGHPVTTGLSTIDYFLSNQAMEISTAQEHYSELLIKLPKIGFHVPLPPFLNIQFERSNFGINPNDIVYLCSQTLLKYLPKYDDLLAQISHQVKQAKFIFIDHNFSSSLVDLFKNRVNKSFEKYNLNFDQKSIFLSMLPAEKYFELYLCSDVFLDTVGWSGGITSMDAIACALPIVTLPKELMRSRQSCGMLKLIDVTEGIAQNEEDYVRIAVRLGKNKEWRQNISTKMKQNSHKLFDDLEGLRGLEAFYIQSLQSYLSSNTPKTK